MELLIPGWKRRALRDRCVTFRSKIALEEKYRCVYDACDVIKKSSQNPYFTLGGWDSGNKRVVWATAFWFERRARRFTRIYMGMEYSARINFEINPFWTVSSSRMNIDQLLTAHSNAQTMFRKWWDLRQTKHLHPSIILCGICCTVHIQYFIVRTELYISQQTCF